MLNNRNTVEARMTSKVKVNYRYAWWMDIILWYCGDWGWWGDEGYKVILRIGGIWVNMGLNMTSEVKVK